MGWEHMGRVCQGAGSGTGQSIRLQMGRGCVCMGRNGGHGAVYPARPQARCGAGSEIVASPAARLRSPAAGTTHEIAAPAIAGSTCRRCRPHLPPVLAQLRGPSCRPRGSCEEGSYHGAPAPPKTAPPTPDPAWIPGGSPRKKVCLGRVRVGARVVALPGSGPGVLSLW